MKCEIATCKKEAITSYKDKAQRIWRLCTAHREQARRNRA